MKYDLKYFIVLFVSLSLSCLCQEFLDGFTFCSMLNRSMFNMDRPLNWIMNYENHLLHFRIWKQNIVNLIDRDAEYYFTPLQTFTLKSMQPLGAGTLSNITKHPDPYHLKRAACFFAADGHSRYVNDGRSFVSIFNGAAYFPGVGYPTIMEQLMRSNRINNRISRTFPIGYLLMVHKNPDSVITLVKAIYDPHLTLILIHVDAKYPEIHSHLSNFFSGNDLFKNVLVDPFPMKVYWGHSSMLFAQQYGFFKLYDMGRCSYFINLRYLTLAFCITFSGDHYPLQSPWVIYSSLLKRDGFSWIGYLRGFKTRFIDIADRVNNIPIMPNAAVTPPHFAGQLVPLTPPLNATYHSASHSSTDLGVRSQLLDEWPKQDFSWSIRKSHQWVVLSQKFVYEMRYSIDAVRELANMEFMGVPDELYYSTIGEWLTPQKIFSKSSTFMNWRMFAAHPEVFTMNEVNAVRKAHANGELFIRKVVVHPDNPLIQEIDFLIRHRNFHESNARQ